VVTAWSALTAATGMVHTYLVMLVTRFTFGMAEAGAFPGATRAIVNWLEPGKRGLANGVMFSGSRIGGAFAFPVITWLIAATDWRRSFFILGTAGLAWAVAWIILFRDYPRDPKAADAGKPTAFAAAKVKFSWDVFRSWPLFLAMVQYFASNFTFYLCLTWMFVYLLETYHLSPEQASGYAAMPLLFGAASQWVTGWFVDSLSRSRFRGWSRRLPAIVGFALSGGGMLALAWADTANYAVACFTVATFGADMTISPSWSFCGDIGGTHAASVSASMNMIGNLGSFASAGIFPVLLALTGSGSAYFAVAAAMNFAAIGCWIGMRSLPPLPRIPAQV